MLGPTTEDEMFITRQSAYFEEPRFVPAKNIRWKRVGDQIFRHENFRSDAFYGDPDEARQIVQSPKMLDYIYGRATKTD